jgi:hypothetical protein
MEQHTSQSLWSMGRIQSKHKMRKIWNKYLVGETINMSVVGANMLVAECNILLVGDNVWVVDDYILLAEDFILVAEVQS